MRLCQFKDVRGTTRVGIVSEQDAQLSVLRDFQTTYQLAQRCMRDHVGMEQLVASSAIEDCLEFLPLLSSGRMLPPLAHPDPHHCLVSGTGLTHLGSATARDDMHRAAAAFVQGAAPATDSSRMFQLGVESGRPAGETPGAQPEWFYKGNGSNVVGCGQPIIAPDFALDCGEEPEIVGLYAVSEAGVPYRLGFAIGNEFSDHVTERQNYLYLAHSKLRQCSVGPELRTGELPAHLEGISRIRRGENIRWQRPFLTGEANMCHSLANLEYHHFKYPAHRQPGDVHLHFFGTATLSFSDGIRVEPGDRFEIDLPALGAPLINPLQVAGAGLSLRGVRSL